MLRKLLANLLKSKLGRTLIEHLLQAFYVAVIQYLKERLQKRTEGSFEPMKAVTFEVFLSGCTHPDLAKEFVNRFMNTGHIEKIE
jgi:hypothetical protein